jgi:hypothetical protein
MGLNEMIWLLAGSVGLLCILAAVWVLIEQRKQP